MSLQSKVSSLIWCFHSDQMFTDCRHVSRAPRNKTWVRGTRLPGVVHCLLLFSFFLGGVRSQPKPKPIHLSRLIGRLLFLMGLGSRGVRSGKAAHSRYIFLYFHVLHWNGICNFFAPAQNVSARLASRIMLPGHMQERFFIYFAQVVLTTYTGCPIGVSQPCGSWFNFFKPEETYINAV